ncbi:MAG: CPBP family intramembrane metalloprotease [Clostridia bacterium]|nr:CPBP family intramembrane metalloprotease [Clostridia bacterium]
METNFYSYDPEQAHQQKLNAISTIRKHGNFTGAATLFFVIFAIAVVFALELFDLSSRIMNDEVLSECFDIALTFFGIFIPFFIVMLKVRRYHPDHSFELEKPKDKKLALWAIPTGLMLCLLGDKIASFISAFFDYFGVELTSTSSSLPNSGIAAVLYFLSVVVIAPLVEEFAMRAVTMQPLRKYGEKFAIVMTAFVFALMHQNMVQGIFAFIAGLVFGYVCILTGSVWCSIAIHCLNNFLSVVSMAVNESTAEGSSVVFYNFLVIAINVFGVIGAVMIIMNKNRPKLQKSALKNLMIREKVAAFLFAPPMLIAIVIMAINCLF